MRENATESDLPLTLFLLPDFRRASINRKDQTGMWTITLTPPKQSSVLVDPKESCLLLIDFYEEQDSARSEPCRSLPRGAAAQGGGSQGSFVSLFRGGATLWRIRPGAAALRS